MKLLVWTAPDGIDWILVLRRELVVFFIAWAS
jgi:hypothetical protein